MLKITIKKISKPMGPFVRDSLIPRGVFLPYWISYIVLFFVGLIRNIVAGRPQKDKPSKLCIEAGSEGWKILEYKELYASACDYIGAEQVSKVSVTQDKKYLKQLSQAVSELSPTHYLYSPRTGSQNWIIALYQSFWIAIFFHWHNVIPIVSLTDLPVRVWRAQSAVITSQKGVVVNFIAPENVQPIFPHKRLIGPSLMPISATTMEHLDGLSTKSFQGAPPTAVFAGSLYEPRTSLLKEISQGLEQKGFNLDIKGRKMENKRGPDSEYWQTLVDASLVVTTAEQKKDSHRDWNWIPHFLYRYTEVLVCGSLLVAPDIPGISRYFKPEVHFVAFSSPNQAVEKIAYYLNNETLLKKIADQGKKKAQALIRSHTYWVCIDTGLGKDSLT